MAITWKKIAYSDDVATVALDNLASVAINTTLVSDTDNTDDLGTDAVRWKDLFLSGVIESGGGLWDDAQTTGITVHETNTIHMDTNSAECALFSAIGVLTLPKQSAAREDRITSVFSVNNLTWTNLDANSEIYDTQSEYNLTTDVFTCTEAGIYLVEGCALFLAVADGRFTIVRIELNGTSVGEDARYNFSGGAANLKALITMPVLCAATDTLEVVLLHNSGAAINVDFDGYDTHASFTKIT